MKKLLIICILIVGIVLVSGCTSEEKTNSESQSNDPLINPTTLLKGYKSVEYKSYAMSEMVSFDAQLDLNVYGMEQYEGEIPNGKKRVATIFTLRKDDDEYSTFFVIIRESDSNLKFKEMFDVKHQYFSEMYPSNIMPNVIETNIIGDYSTLISHYPEDNPEDYQMDRKSSSDEFFGTQLYFTHKNYIITIQTKGPNKDECRTESMKLANAILDELK